MLKGAIRVLPAAATVFISPVAFDKTFEALLSNAVRATEGTPGVEQADLDRLARALAGLEANGVRLADLRPGIATRHRVTLNTDMGKIQEAAAMRREVAATILAAILGRVPATEAPNADLLADFTLEQLCEAVESALVQDELGLVIQVNGKLRGSMSVARNMVREAIEQLAVQQPCVQKYLEGMSVKKTIVVPGKLVNIVVG